MFRHKLIYKMLLFPAAALMLTTACGTAAGTGTGSTQDKESQVREIPEEAEAGSDVENTVSTADNADNTMEDTDSDDTVSDNDSQTTAEESQEQTTDNNDPGKSLFEDMSRYSYCFTSGVGAWDTELNISPDGSFSGRFHDTDMGDTGDGYPNGTVYQSDFTGRFSDPVYVDEYTYTTGIEEIKYAKEPEKEEIGDDGVRYISATAYGLDEADTIYIYRPGKPVSDIPEGYMWWYNVLHYGPDKEGDEDSKLESYGIYNETPDCGFISTQERFTADELKSIYQEVIEKQKKIDDRFENEDMDQTTMNMLSYDEYHMWDDLINDIWSYLKETLPEDEMASLKEEQVKWIKNKEDTVAAEGAQYEGGSIQPLIENGTAARMTRERVDELIKKYLQ